MIFLQFYSSLFDSGEDRYKKLYQGATTSIIHQVSFYFIYKSMKNLLIHGSRYLIHLTLYQSFGVRYIINAWFYMDVP